MTEDEFSYSDINLEGFDEDIKPKIKHAFKQMDDYFNLLKMLEPYKRNDPKIHKLLSEHFEAMRKPNYLISSEELANSQIEDLTFIYKLAKKRNES